LMFKADQLVHKKTSMMLKNSTITYDLTAIALFELKSRPKMNLNINMGLKRKYYFSTVDIGWGIG